MNHCGQCGQVYQGAGHVCNFQTGQNYYGQRQQGMSESNFEYQMRTEIESIHRKLNEILKKLEELK